jgi:hypothetical protein
MLLQFHLANNILSLVWTKHTSRGFGISFSVTTNTYFFNPTALKSITHFTISEAVFSAVGKTADLKSSLSHCLNAALQWHVYDCYIDMCMYIDMCIWQCACTFTFICTWTLKCACTWTCAFNIVHVHWRVHLTMCMCIEMCMYIDMCMCIEMCMYIDMYMYIECAWLLHWHMHLHWMCMKVTLTYTYMCGFSTHSTLAATCWPCTTWRQSSSRKATRSDCPSIGPMDS